jgi:hypothetical protein
VRYLAVIELLIVIATVGRLGPDAME